MLGAVRSSLRAGAVATRAPLRARALSAPVIDSVVKEPSCGYREDARRREHYAWTVSGALIVVVLGTGLGNWIFGSDYSVRSLREEVSSLRFDIAQLNLKLGQRDERLGRQLADAERQRAWLPSHASSAALREG